MSTAQTSIGTAEAITGELFVTEVGRLAEQHTRSGQLTGLVDSAVQSELEAGAVEQSILVAQRVLRNLVESAGLARDNEALRVRLLQQAAGRVAVVSVEDADLHPIHAYRDMHRQPESPEMGGLSLHRHLRHGVWGLVTGVFLDGSFRVDPIHSGLDNIKRHIPFGFVLDEARDDAYRIYTYNTKSPPAVSVTFEQAT